MRPVRFLHTGVVMLGPTAEVPLAAVRQCFDANVFGLLELCQVGTAACYAVLCCCSYSRLTQHALSLQPC